MAVTFTGAGVAVAASGASPQAVTTATAFAVGDVLVALMAYDNSGSAGADPMTGTLTPTPVTGALSASLSAQTGLNDPSSASAGICTRCVAWRVTTAIPSGTVINFAWSGTVVVRTMTLMKVSSAANTTYITNSGATGSNSASATTMALATPSVTNGQGVLCWAGYEYGAVVVGDADTTNGSWSAVYGTNTGTTAAGISGYFQSKVVNATAVQNFNPTGSTASYWIVGCLIFAETTSVTATRSTTWNVRVVSIEQAAYQFFDDSGTEPAAPSLAAINTAINGNLGNGDGFGVLRIRLQNNTIDALPATDDYQLQWEKNGNGTWTNITAASSTVQGYANPQLGDGGGTNNRMGAGTGSYVTGKISNDGLLDNLSLTGSNYTELVYSLKLLAANFTDGDTLRFRVLRNGVTTGMTYTQVPTINIVRVVTNIVATRSTTWNVDAPPAGGTATVGAHTYATSGGTSCTVATPAHSPGDLLVWFMGNNQGQVSPSYQVPDASAGTWVLAGQVTGNYGGYSPNGSVYLRTAGASEPSTFQCNSPAGSSGQNHSAAMVAVNGAAAAATAAADIEVLTGEHGLGPLNLPGVTVPTGGVALAFSTSYPGFGNSDPPASGPWETLDNWDPGVSIRFTGTGTTPTCVIPYGGGDTAAALIAIAPSAPSTTPVSAARTTTWNVAAVVVYSDDFNRANGALTTPWVNVDSTHSIVSNRVPVGPVDGTVTKYNATFAADQWVEADIAGRIVGSSTMFPAARITPSGDFYYIWVSTSNITFWKRIGGSYSQVGGTGSLVGTAFKARLEVEGTTLRAYIDGTLALTATDPSLATGVAGIISSGGAGASLDNFRAGDLPYVPITGGTTPVTASRTTTWNVAATGGPFAPTDITGCAFWFDANDAASLSLSGSTVTAWNDKSGSGRNMTSVGSPQRGTVMLNGKPTITFNGAQQFYWPGVSYVNTTTLTVVAVVRITANTPSQRAVSLSHYSSPDWNDIRGAIAIGQEGGVFPAAYRNATLSADDSLDVGTWKIAYSIFNGTTHTMYVDNVAQTPVASTGTFDFDLLTIGSNNGGGDSLYGDIAEIVTYTQALGSTDRASLYNYLNTKWLGVGTTPVSASRSTTWNVAALAITSFTDDFNRAGPALGSSWAVLSGTDLPVISGNHVITSATAANNASVVAGLTGTNQWGRISASLGPNYSESGVLLHAVDSDHTFLFTYVTDGEPYGPGIFGATDGPALQLYVLYAAGPQWRFLAETPGPASGTHVIYGINVGRTFQYWFDGVRVFNVDDSGHTEIGLVGEVGFTIHRATAGTETIIDDFAGGSYVTAPSAPTITGFTPSSGLPGATITVSGTDFIKDATMFTVAGYTVPVTVTSSTTGTFVVPNGPPDSWGVSIGTPFGFAYDGFTIAAPTTPVTASRTTTWRTFARITATRTTTWNVNVTSGAFPFYDNFERANGDPGANYEVFSGEFTIISGALKGTGLGGNWGQGYIAPTPPSADQYTEYTCPVPSAFGGTDSYLRASGGFNTLTGYVVWWYWDGGGTFQVGFGDVTAGTAGTGGNTYEPGFPSAPFTIRGEILGTTWKLFYNGTQLGTGTISTVSQVGRMALDAYDNGRYNSVGFGLTSVTTPVSTSRTTTWNIEPLFWKGTGVITTDHSNLAADLATVKVGWWYDWTNWQVGTGRPDPIYHAPGIQYVPMVWGDWISDPRLGPPDNWDLGAGPYAGDPIILGFNEPDDNNQARMSVSRALALWPQFEATGARLGSPAGTGGSTSWLADFMDGDGAGYVPRVDFICLHFYPGLNGSMTDFANYLDYMHGLYNKPIWVTEFSALQGDVTSNAALVDQVMAVCLARPWVERLAWFILGPYPQFAGTKLVESNGALTATGAEYDDYEGRIPRSTAAQVTASRSTTWSTKASVTASRSTTWRALAGVTSTRATTWVAKAAVTATRATTWTALSVVTPATRATTWVARASITSTRSTTWQALVPIAAPATRSTTWVTKANVTANRATSWHALAAIAAPATRSTTWTTLASVTANRSTTWGVIQGVVASRTTLWNTAGSLISVTASRSTTWFVQATVSASRATTWAATATMATPATRSTTWVTRAVVTVARATTWQALVPIAAPATRTTSWVVRASVTGTRVSTWTTLFAVPAASRTSSWNVAGANVQVTVSRSTTWSVLTPVSAARATTWVTRSQVLDALATTWTTQTQVTTNRSTSWSVAGTLSFVMATRTTSWITKAVVTGIKATTWQVLTPVATASRSTTWTTLRTVTPATRATTWFVRATVAASRDTTWVTRATIVTNRAASTWDVLRAITPATRTTTWRVSTGVTATRTTTWVVRALVTGTRVTTWNTLAPLYAIAVARTTTWRIRQRIIASRTTTWNTSPSAPMHDYLVLYPNTVMYLGEHLIKALYQTDAAGVAVKIWP